MTISSTVSRNDYIGNGAASVYSYTFRILDEADLLVTTRDTLGNSSTLVLGVDYTVTGANNPSGGSITLLAGNLATGIELAIRRVVPLTQETDIRNQGDFLPEVHEDQFDRHVMADQQQQDEIDRSVKLPEVEAGSAAATTLPSVADRSSKFLAFDASGNPIASDGPGGVPVSSFMETVVDDTTGSAALTTLRNDLLEETAPAVDDEVFLRDTSDPGVDRMTLANLLKVINQLPTDSNPDPDNDFVLTYDTTAGAARKAAPALAAGVDAAVSAAIGSLLRSGLVVKTNTTNPNFQVDVSASRLSVQGVLLSSVAATADITVSGANGLDTGVEANSTWYAVHVITNDTGSLVAALLSTSATSPTLPGGYTKFRRVGYVRNNASSNLVHFYQDDELVTYNDRPANAFYSPTIAGTTDTTQSVVAYVPPGVSSVMFDANVGVNSTSTAFATPAANFQLRTDSSGAYHYVVSCADFNSAGGSLSGGTVAGFFFRVTGSRDIDVRFFMQGNNQSGGGTLYVSGYKEVL